MTGCHKREAEPGAREDELAAAEIKRRRIQAEAPIPGRQRRATYRDNSKLEPDSYFRLPDYLALEQQIGRRAPLLRERDVRVAPLMGLIVPPFHLYDPPTPANPDPDDVYPGRQARLTREEENQKKGGPGSGDEGGPGGEAQEPADMSADDLAKLICFLGGLDAAASRSAAMTKKQQKQTEKRAVDPWWREYMDLTARIAKMDLPSREEEERVVFQQWQRTRDRQMLLLSVKMQQGALRDQDISKTLPTVQIKGGTLQTALPGMSHKKDTRRKRTPLPLPLLLRRYLKSTTPMISPTLWPTESRKRERRSGPSPLATVVTAAASPVAAVAPVAPFDSSDSLASLAPPAAAVGLRRSLRLMQKKARLQQQSPPVVPPAMPAPLPATRPFLSPAANSASSLDRPPATFADVAQNRAQHVTGPAGSTWSRLASEGSSAAGRTQMLECYCLGGWRCYDLDCQCTCHDRLAESFCVPGENEPEDWIEYDEVLTELIVEGAKQVQTT